MYSERYLFIYVRVTKTASTSIVAALSALTNGDARTVSNYRGLQNSPTHLPLYEYAPYVSAPLEQYFTFTFVRNPWDRMVSGYFYSRRQKMRRAHLLDFREWCYYRAQRYQYNNCRWHSQSVAYDFVGRFETLQEDFNRLCARLELAHTTLPHKNASAHGDYRQYYTDEVRALIARKYARDIDQFGYTF